MALKVKPLNLSFKQLVTFDRLMAGMLYQAALPVVLNEACWGLTNITYNIIYGRMGVNAIATTQITTTIMNLFMIVVFGMAHASVVVIGNEIGANQEEQAIIYAKKIIRLALIIAVVMAVGLVLFAPAIVGIYKVSDLVRQNAIQIVGILRGGGDAKYGSIVQGLSMWIFGIPFGIIGAFIFKWPITYVIFLISCEEVIRYLIISRRFRSNKWINNMVREMA